MLTQKTRKEEKEPQPFGSSLYMFSSPPPGPALCKLGRQECCLFYLRSSLQSLDLPLLYFLRLFPSLSLATAILDSFFLF